MCVFNELMQLYDLSRLLWSSQSGPPLLTLTCASSFYVPCRLPGSIFHSLSLKPLHEPHSEPSCVLSSKSLAVACSILLPGVDTEGKGEKKRIVFLSIPQRPPFLVFCVFWFLPQRPVLCLAHIYLLAPCSVNQCRHEKGALEMESQGPGLSSHTTWPHRHWLDPSFQTRALYDFLLAYLKPTGCSEKHVRLKIWTACFMRGKKKSLRDRGEKLKKD